MDANRAAAYAFASAVKRESAGVGDEPTMSRPPAGGVPAAAANAAANAPEDAAAEGGTAIDTFSSYVPAALPKCVLSALAESAAGRSRPATTTNDTEIIEILDTDNEDSRLDVPEGDSAESVVSLFKAMPSHTSPAVESALLSSVTASVVHDEAASTVLELVKQGKLSPLQAEGVCLAITRFTKVFQSNGTGAYNASSRAGFFIGDGAGIGKGRQIAATIRDALCRNQGKGRHLWVSVSRELVQDAKRDLDVGCHVPVHDGAEVLDQMGGGKKGKALGAGGSLGKGVLFITYSLLVSGKRLDDIIKWLSGDSASKKTSQQIPGANLEHTYTGMIVFDEAHKAKNLEKDTRTGKLVLALQNRLPQARVLYASATGVSDIKHMAYGVRLGLWGSANPLYPSFDAFQGALAKRGVGALEMLALEMKSKGVFLARTLSWDGAEFQTLEVNLTRDQISMYDAAVDWWNHAKAQLEMAIDKVGAPKLIWRAYWAAHQRFFKELCICAKIDEVVRQAKDYLNQDCSIVIGLQATGESGMEVALEELAKDLVNSERKTKRGDTGGIDYEEMQLSGLVSTSASVLKNFVRNHFPIAPPPAEPPKVPPVPSHGFASESEMLEHHRLAAEAEKIRNLPPPEPVQELVERRDALLDTINTLELPANPLDDLIDRLGGVDNVAEMTGRSGRILRDRKGGKYSFVKRGGASKQKSFGLSMPVSREDEQDRLNIVEKRKFMDGKKTVAIISDAASTGISLHADKRCKSSDRRRVHFTIELPWAADKAIQQLGRSHRSGQVSAPIYKMCVTELGGERRFASAVSKRMAQLGALTKGDRRAASGTDMSDFDIDSQFGRRALIRVYTALSEQPIAPPSRNADALDNFVKCDVVAPQVVNMDEEGRRVFALESAAAALHDVGLIDDAKALVKNFLNRIAGLDVARQNLVFSLFMSTLDDIITDAKATGEFEGSVEDVRATTISLKEEPAVIATDTSSGALTRLTKLTVDRGISFDSMVRIALDEYPNTEGNDANEGTEEAAAIENKEDDDDELDDEEMEDDSHGVSGFYISKRKVAGRRLVMYAQRKVSKEDEMDSDFIDPLKLMIISRPNTGKNPCEMTSSDLRYKYDLLLSASDVIEHARSGERDDKSVEMDDAEDKDEKDVIGSIRSNWSNVADLWDDAFDNSNQFEHNDGLAPRLSELGLITGATLHILPALEKAVQFMNASQRSLRVMRVEITETGQRIVGIKYPITGTALERLHKGMAEVAAARQGSLGTPSFVDEGLAPIDAKATSWATTERKTMKSFFGAAAAPTGGKKRASPMSAEENNSKKKPPVKSGKSASSTKGIGSFFGAKKSY